MVDLLQTELSNVLLEGKHANAKFIQVKPNIIPNV